MKNILFSFFFILFSSSIFAIDDGPEQTSNLSLANIDGTQVILPSEIEEFKRIVLASLEQDSKSKSEFEDLLNSINSEKISKEDLNLLIFLDLALNGFDPFSGNYAENIPPEYDRDKVLKTLAATLVRGGSLCLIGTGATLVTCGSAGVASLPFITSSALSWVVYGLSITGYVTGISTCMTGVCMTGGGVCSPYFTDEEEDDDEFPSIFQRTFTPKKYINRRIRGILRKGFLEEFRNDPEIRNVPEIKNFDALPAETRLEVLSLFKRLDSYPSLRKACLGKLTDKKMQ